MKTLRLYPPVERKGQSFADEKTMAIPSQSMSLKEIIQRFVRRESLPVMRDGVYIEGLGDLEKMAHEDMTYTDERIADLKRRQAAFKEKAEREKVQAEAAKASPPAPPAPPKSEGEPTLKSPDPKGP